jgi:hypothetical protein
MNAWALAIKVASKRIDRIGRRRQLAQRPHFRAVGSSIA